MSEVWVTPRREWLAGQWGLGRSALQAIVVTPRTVQPHAVLCAYARGQGNELRFYCPLELRLGLDKKIFVAAGKKENA